MVEEAIPALQRLQGLSKISESTLKQRVTLFL